jgi:hypothetical protein
MNCPAFERHRALRRKRPMSDTSISNVTTLCGLNRAGLAIARLGVVLVSGAVIGRVIQRRPSLPSRRMKSI